VVEEEMGGHATQMRENRTSYMLFIGTSQGKGPLGRSRRRLMNIIIIMYLVEIGWGGFNCIGLAQDRYNMAALVNA
jgi:hypothetical protein